MQKIEVSSDNTLHNLVHVRKAKLQEIADYYDVSPRTVGRWIERMEKRQNPEQGKKEPIKKGHSRMRKRPDDFILYDLFFNRKIAAAKIAQKYNTTQASVHTWKYQLKKKLKADPEYKRNIIDKMIQYRATSKKSTAPKMPHLPKSDPIPVHPWGTPIVDESVASDVADNQIRHAMMLDAITNQNTKEKPKEISSESKPKEEPKETPFESKPNVLPPMQKEIYMAETLQE